MALPTHSKDPIAPELGDSLQPHVQAILDGNPAAIDAFAPLIQARAAGGVEFGVSLLWPPYDDAEITLRRLGEFRLWVERAERGRIVSSYMDTSTIFNAVSLVSRRSSDPTFDPVVDDPFSGPTLFDLNTFVRSVVFDAHIFHLPSSFIDTEQLNEWLGNDPIFQSLSLTDEAERGEMGSVTIALVQLFGQVRRHIDAVVKNGHLQQDDATAITDAWQSLLGRPVAITDLIDPDESRNWASPSPVLLRTLLRAIRQTVELEPEDDDEFGMRRYIISESTYRSLFNLRVAEVLGLSYAGSVCRLPIRKWHYARALALDGLLRLHGALKDAVHSQRHYYLAGDAVIELPVPLSVVLSRIDNLSEFFPTLADLRSQAATFRDHRAELEDLILSDLTSRRAREIEKLQRALRGDVSTLRRGWLAPVAGVIATTLIGAFSGVTGVLLGALAMLSAHDRLPTKQSEAIVRRMTRPQYWFLSELAGSAASINAMGTKVQKLWSVSDDEIRQARTSLNRIGSLGWN